MIKANELRIGNYVNMIFSENTFSTIDGITSEGVNLNEVTWDYVKFDDINPIPLTEQWLLDFGFEKTNNERSFEFWTIGENGFIAGEPLFHLKRQHKNDKYFFVNIRYAIQYVHQLQNLFYSLTGIELTLKQPT